jgi:ribosomal protein S18 acetylase RimI-like enzyme
VLDSSLRDAETSSAAAEPPRIHLASPADVPFIVDAIVAESRRGHFSCDCTQPDVLRGLWHQIQTIVSEGVAPMPGARDGVGARAFVIQVGQANAGFAILLEQAPGSWFRRIELFALATHEAHRRRGLARQLVRSLVRDAQSEIVLARCAPASAAMVQLLEGCGFARVPADAGGVQLEFRSAPAPQSRDG